jgi:hypothetical protein
VTQPESTESPQSERIVLVKLISQGVLALVLLIGMIWIVLSPVTDEATKGALVILGGAAGFVFGRQTA